MRAKIFSLVSVYVFLIFLSGCGVDRLFLDESNLEKVVKYYYAIGKTSLISNTSCYHFACKKSKEQISLDEHKNFYVDTGKNFTKSVTVLGEKRNSNGTYAIVSTSFEPEDKSGGAFKDIFTNTWILEDGKWRRLTFPKYFEKCSKALQDGDYTTAKKIAEDWLLDDPYCERAYSSLLDAMSRTNDMYRVDVKTNGRTKDDVIRAMLAINPNDSFALVSAVSYSDTPYIAKSYLKKLEGSSMYSNAVFDYAIHFKSTKEELSFLKDVVLTPEIAMLKMQTIAICIGKGDKGYSWNDFDSIAHTEGTFEKIKNDLDLNDPSFAANWSGTMGLCFVGHKDNIMANKYLDYGITRDPNNELVKSLANILGK